MEDKPRSKGNSYFRRSDFEKTIKTLWLFDLEKDPAEHNDIAAQHPDIVESLKTRLEKYRKTMVTPLLLVPNMLWTTEKVRHMAKRRKTGQRRFPGVPYAVADWWDTDEEMAKNGMGMSKL